MAGIPTVSDVVRSAVHREPVIAFAEPYSSPTGRRVFSGAYAVSSTPLRSYLVNEVGNGRTFGAAYLVDGRGAIIASGRSGPVQSGALTRIDAPLAGAVGLGGARTIGAGPSQREAVTVAVPGTPWRLCHREDRRAVPARDGPGPLGAWIVLLALALTGLIVIALLERTVRQRQRLAEEHVRSRAVLDTAVDAFVGMDEAGRITDWNPAAEHLLGWTAAEAGGSSWPI
jgi:PAS domain-containing protein